MSLLLRLLIQCRFLYYYWKFSSVHALTGRVLNYGYTIANAAEGTYVALHGMLVQHLIVA
jgi:hypothetical protein